MDRPDQPFLIGDQRSRKICRMRRDPGEHFFRRHIKSQPCDGFIIVDPVIQSHHFRKAGPPGSSGDLYHIDLSVLFDQITVYRTVIQSHRLYGETDLTFHLRPQAVLFSVGNRVSYRCGDIALTHFCVVRQTIEKPAVIHHGFAPQKPAFDKLFQKAVILPGGRHGFLIIIQHLFHGIAAEDPPASHEVHRFYHQRELELPGRFLKLGRIMDTDMFCTAYSAGHERFFHPEFIPADRSRFRRHPFQAHLFAYIADGPHSRVKAACCDPVYFMFPGRFQYGVRIGYICIGNLVRRFESRPFSRRTDRHRGRSDFLCGVVKGQLGIAGAQDHKFFHGEVTPPVPENQKTAVFLPYEETECAFL